MQGKWNGPTHHNGPTKTTAARRIARHIKSGGISSILSVFQTAVFILYITFGKITGGSPPIITDNVDLYSNPLPHVLILTAIVVGVATTSVGLALIVRIEEAYGSTDEDDIHDMDDNDDFHLKKQV